MYLKRGINRGTLTFTIIKATSWSLISGHGKTPVAVTFFGMLVTMWAINVLPLLVGSFINWFKERVQQGILCPYVTTM